MPNYEEVFTRRFGGGKRTYYLDVKKDTNGEKYIVISESTRKDGDKKMRNRVMIWKEDFEAIFDCMKEMEEFLEAEAAREDGVEPRLTTTSNHSANGSRSSYSMETTLSEPKS